MELRIEKLHITGNLLQNLRRAGYVPFQDPHTEKESFVCRLGADFYPRFHLYLTSEEHHFLCALHLDQKHTSYAGTAHMHNGEYEGEHIQKELERIRGWILSQETKTS